MIEELVIRNWRVSEGIPSGVHVWFDPSCESVRLFRSSPPDSPLLKPEHQVRDDVAEGEVSSYLDKVGSVSAYGLAGKPVVGEPQQISFLEEEADLSF